MIRFWKLTDAFLVLACLAWAQGLAPEVLLLARIKSHMREELSNLPNYTCLESITRFRKEPGSRKRFQGQIRPLDVVRLEIVYTNHREWYGSPGGRNLSADNPFGFVGSGMIGTGAFAQGLNNLLEGATIRYRGEEAMGGRTAVRYDFHLPRFLKALVISVPGGSGTVGEEGSFWVDPHSLDFIRLESHANEIPPYLPVEDESQIVNYARTRIGERNVLLAQQADLHLAVPTRKYSHLTNGSLVLQNTRTGQRYTRAAKAPRTSRPTSAAGRESSYLTQQFYLLLPISAET